MAGRGRGKTLPAWMTAHEQENQAQPREEKAAPPPGLQEERRRYEQRDRNSPTSSYSSSVNEAIEIDAVIEGRVARIAPFGAFVTLRDGRDGLVHISEIMEGYCDRVEDVVQVGDIVKVRVLELDGKRIGLSMRRAMTPPETGSIVEGTVTRLVDFGCFVQLDSGTNMVGLVHISDLAAHRVEQSSDIVQTGQRVFCKVLEPSDRGIKLSMRAVDQTTGQDLSAQRRTHSSQDPLFDLPRDKDRNNGVTGDQFDATKTRYHYVDEDKHALPSKRRELPYSDDSDRRRNHKKKSQKKSKKKDKRRHENDDDYDEDHRHKKKKKKKKRKHKHSHKNKKKRKKKDGYHSDIEPPLKRTREVDIHNDSHGQDLLPLSHASDANDRPSIQAPSSRQVEDIVQFQSIPPPSSHPPEDAEQRQSVPPPSSRHLEKTEEPDRQHLPAFAGHESTQEPALHPPSQGVKDQDAPIQISSPRAEESKGENQHPSLQRLLVKNEEQDHRQEHPPRHFESTESANDQSDRQLQPPRRSDDVKKLENIRQSPPHRRQDRSRSPPHRRPVESYRRAPPRHDRDDRPSAFRNDNRGRRRSPSYSSSSSRSSYSSGSSYSSRSSSPSPDFGRDRRRSRSRSPPQARGRGRSPIPRSGRARF